MAIINTYIKIAEEELAGAFRSMKIGRSSNPGKIAVELFKPEIKNQF